MGDNAKDQDAEVDDDEIKMKDFVEKLSMLDKLALCSLKGQYVSVEDIVSADQFIAKLRSVGNEKNDKTIN